MGRRLILNPGRNEIILENSEAGYSGDTLWLYIRGIDMAEAFALLSNSANTGVIVFEYGEMTDRYEGMTRLTGIISRDALVSAALERGAKESV